MRDPFAPPARPLGPRSPALLRAVLATVVLIALASPGIGQLQFTEFLKRNLPLRADDMRAVVLDDVDRDSDLVFANFGPAGQNRLYRNAGNGAFTDVTATRMPQLNDVTRAVALEDVDRDGDHDLVFGNDGQQNRLYLNDGTGTFVDLVRALDQCDRGSDSALNVSRSIARRRCSSRARRWRRRRAGSPGS